LCWAGPELLRAILERYPDAVVALAELGAEAPGWARDLLDEMSLSDLTLADLHLRTDLEEIPEMTMLGDALAPDMFERLRELESFREYEVKVEAQAKAAVAEAKAEAEAATVGGALNEFLVLRGDVPSEYAINTISACRTAGVLSVWLRRAYLGETSAQLFPEPDPRAD
jgi:hypothetical protein